MSRSFPDRTLAQAEKSRNGASIDGGKVLSAHRALALGLVVAATFLAFLPALSAGFVNWDDYTTVVDNQVINSLAWPNVKWMFTHPIMGHYQPLALLSLALDYQFWGLEPFGYHLTNVLLHILNAVLFFFLTVELLRLVFARPAGEASAAPASKSLEPAITIGAAAAAMLFAIHPLRVESVAWVTQRRDVLSAFFYLAAALAYLKAHNARESGLRGCGRPATSSARFWLLASAALITLSLLTKVIAITATAVFLLLDWYPLGRLGGSRGWWSPAARRVWLEKALFLLPAVVLALAAVHAQSTYAAWRGVESAGALKPALGGLYGLSFYLWKTVWPTALCACYEMPSHAADIDLRLVIAGVAVLMAGVPLWIWRRHQPGLLIAWACYLVLVFPVLGVLQNWPQIAADRYTYLPCMGWAILIGAAITRSATGARANYQRLTLITAAAAVAVGLGLLTWRQSQVWSSSLDLWQRVLSVEPNNYFGRMNYGEALVGTDQPKEAIIQFNQAIQLRPAAVEPYVSLGRAFIAMQQYRDAAWPLQTALRLDPKNAKAHSRLGVVLYQTGDITAAMDHLRTAVELAPDDPGNRASLGWHLRRQGQLDQAIEQLETATELSPTNARYWNELAGTLQESKRDAQAINVLCKGLAPTGRDPNLLDALARLRATCSDQAYRNPEEAVRLAREACEATGHQSAHMLETLALAYDAGGHQDEAMKALESAIATADHADEKETAQRCRDKLAQMRKNPS